MHTKKMFRSSVLIFLLSIFIFNSCTEEDVTRNVYQYKVRYEVINYMDVNTDVYITYADPDIANYVSEYLEDVKKWDYEFTGFSLDRCYLEAVVANDSANLAVKIYVDSSLAVYDSASCISPIVCDTTRIALSHTLE